MQIRRYLSISRVLRSVNVVEEVLYSKEEVEKFGKIASEWWNPNSNKGTGPLHALNHVRVSYIKDVIKEHLPLRNASIATPLLGLKMLDVGCGGGLLVESLARLGSNITGIDPSKENIGIARAHSLLDPKVSSNASYRPITVQELVREAKIDQANDDLDDSKLFDVVTCLEVIEHVPIQLRTSFITSLSLMVKPGGLLFMSSINRTNKAYAIAIFAAENLLNVVPVGTHEWSLFIAPQEIEEYLKQNKMKVSNTSGLVINPLNLKWSLAKDDLDVNYIMCAKKEENIEGKKEENI